MNNPYFEQMVSVIYLTALWLNKADNFNTDSPFLNLDLSITNGIVGIILSKIYDKQGDFNFEISKFQFWQ